MTDKLTKGVIFLGLSQLIFMATGYIANVWLGRHLGPEVYGVYGVLTSIMTALGIMQVSGVPQAVSKFTAEKEADASAVLNSAIYVQLGLTITLTLSLIVAAPLVGHIFNDPAIVPFVQGVALIFPLYGLFSLYAGYYNGLHNFRRQALMNISYSITKLVLVVWLTFEFGLAGAIIGFILAPLAPLVFGFRYPPRSSGYYSFKSIIKYSFPLIGYAAIATLLQSIDLFALKALTSSSEVVGFYTAAFNIALIPYLAISALGLVLYPNISKLVYERQYAQARVVISQSLRYLLMFLLPLAVIIAGSAPAVIILLYGQEYLPAVPLLRVLVVGYVLLALFAIFGNILNGAGRAKASFWLAVLGVVVSLACSLLLIPLLGAVGAAIGTIVGGLVAAIGTGVIIFKQFKFSISFLSVARICISTTLVGGTALALPVAPILLPLWAAALSVFYFLLLWLFGEFTQYDRQKIKTLIPAWLPGAKHL